MRGNVWFLSALILPLLALAGYQRGGSGIKIGTGERGTSNKGLGGFGRGNSGVRIGEGRFPNSTRQRSFPTTTTPMPPSKPYPRQSFKKEENFTILKIGLVVPRTSFVVREYTKAVHTAIGGLQRSTRNPTLSFLQHHDIRVPVEMIELTPSPNMSSEISLTPCM